MTTKKIQVCDICNQEVINGYQFKVKRSLISFLLMPFEKQTGTWENFDICEACFEDIKQAKLNNPLKQTLNKI